MIAHWDEVAASRGEAGHIGGEWNDLGAAAGTKTVGVSRIRVDPGKWSTPYTCYYARSNKIYFRGLGLIARLEDLDYDDGKPQ